MRKVIKSICQMCYFYCGIDVTVDDGRIVRIEGSDDHPSNKGRLCPRGLAAGQLISDPNRLRHPLRRVGERGAGNWQKFSWNEALDEIAEGWNTIKEKYGPEYVAYYRGQAPGWVTNFNYLWRLMNLWGIPHLFTHSQLCFTPRSLAHGVTFGKYPEPDFERTNCMMLIGSNVVNTSPCNYARRMMEAKQRGAKLIVIDPRFTQTASKADIYLQNRPGTTGSLVLAMIQVIIEENLHDAEFVEQWTTGFERLKELVKEYTPEIVEPITWVKASKIRKAARMLATTKPALIIDGNGLDQHTNVVQTVRTTSILRSILRLVDEPGGSVMVPALPFIDVQRRGTQPKNIYDKTVSKYPLFTQGGFGLNGVDLIDSIATQKPYGIKSVIVQGGDPVASLSDTQKTQKALKNLDLLVVHDLYPTATSQIADIVLPAASFLERNLILYYRYRPFADGNLIGMQNKCVEPVGESKSDLDFIFELGRRLGFEEFFPWQNVEEAFDWELKPNGITVDWLRNHPEGYVVKYDPEEVFRKYEHEGFATPSKKIELASSILEQHGENPLPTFVEPGISPISKPELAKEYPLILSTGLKLGIHTHTQFRTLPWIREIEPEPFCEIHPQTANSAGIQDKDWVKIETPNGSIKVRARILMTVDPRFILVNHGYGEPYAGKYDLQNLLTSETERDPITGTTGNRSLLCRVRKVEE